MNNATGAQNGYDGSEFRKDGLMGAATGLILEGGSALKGAAGEFERGLPVAVGGALGDSFRRAAPGADGPMHGRNACPPPGPPPNACDLGLLGCAAPLPF